MKWKNKRGNIVAIIVVFLVILLLMAIAVGGAFIVGVFNQFTSSFVPEISGLGQVDNTNFTQISNYALTPVQTIGTSFNWLLGFAYVVALLMVFGLAFSFRFTGNKWLVVFFILLVLALIIVSIIFSNMYEDFYNTNDEIGLGLKAQPLVSYMIIYAPLINTILMILAGVIMFTGTPEEFA